MRPALLKFWLGLLILALAYAWQPASAQEFERLPPETPASEKTRPPAPIAEKDHEPGANAFESLFVHGAYTIIPVPAIAYTRNERYWVGGLTPTLKANAQGDLEQIWAPQYLYNPLVGSTLTFNYYRYVSDTSQYQFVVSGSEKIQRDIHLAYKDLGAGGGRYILGAEVRWGKDPFERFFGFGNRAPETNESNYTARETRVNLTAGLNVNPDLSVMFTERFSDIRLQNGVVASLPQTLQRFAGVPGVENVQLISHKLTIFYDTRDNQLTPTRGRYVNLSGSLNQNILHDDPNRWWRYTLDARQLVPHAGGRMVLIGHLLIDGVNRANGAQLAIPFYERPMLGGQSTLRAFGLNRFISNTAWLINLEERVLVTERKMFGYAIGLEVAPFVDVGRVSNRLDIYRAKIDHAQVNPGVGFRLQAKPNVVGRLDVAYGKDGENFFVGLDYPF